MNKKVFSKNSDFLSLSSTEKKAKTILKISILKPSIYCGPTFVYWIKKLSFLTKFGCIVFTLLPKLIKAYINY